MDGMILTDTLLDRIDDPSVGAARPADGNASARSLPFGLRDWPTGWDKETFVRFTHTRPDDERWELWDGKPRLMPPGTNIHQAIATRLASRLQIYFDDAQLAFEAIVECGVHVGGHDDTLYIPDVAVLRTDAPVSNYARVFVLAAEVLSPSNTYGEIAAKVARYCANPECQHVLVLEQDAPKITVHERSGRDWTERTVSGREATLELPTFGCSIPLEYLYRRVIDR